MNKQLPIYRLTIKEDDLESGVFAISLVDAPAIEENWFAFAKEDEQKFSFKSINTDKQILAGYFMIPDKMIYRNDSGKEYLVVFDKETIEKISEKFNKNLFSNQFNIQHNSEDKAKAFVKENWIVEDENDKSKKYGFEAITGGWFGLVKVEDSAIWSEFIKNGKLNGFSIEGMFEMELEKFFKQEQPKVEPLQNKIQNIYRTNSKENMKVKLELSGQLAIDGELKVGASVNVIDTDGNKTVAPDGEYTLEDGTKVNVKGGVIESITEPVAPEAEPAPVEQAEQTPEEVIPTQLSAEDVNKRVEELFALVTELKAELTKLSETQLKAEQEKQTLVTQIDEKFSAINTQSITEKKEDVKVVKTYADEIFDKINFMKKNGLKN